MDQQEHLPAPDFAGTGVADPGKGKKVAKKPAKRPAELKEADGTDSDGAAGPAKKAKRASGGKGKGKAPQAPADLHESSGLNDEIADAFRALGIYFRKVGKPRNQMNYGGLAMRLRSRTTKVTLENYKSLKEVDSIGPLKIKLMGEWLRTGSFETVYEEEGQRPEDVE